MESFHSLCDTKINAVSKKVFSRDSCETSPWNTNGHGFRVGFGMSRKSRFLKDDDWQQVTRDKVMSDIEHLLDEVQQD